MTASELSLRIDQLALGFVNGSEQQTKNMPPPLPAKQRQRIGSDYDNLYEEDEVDSKHRKQTSYGRILGL